jgi:hypothetical protein
MFSNYKYFSSATHLKYYDMHTFDYLAYFLGFLTKILLHPSEQK